jgi:hypothetical protein
LATEYERRIFVEFASPRLKELVREAAAASGVSMSKYMSHFAVEAAEHHFTPAEVELDAMADQPDDEIVETAPAPAVPEPVPPAVDTGRCSTRACPFPSVEGCAGMCRVHHHDSLVATVSQHGSSLAGFDISRGAEVPRHYKKKTLTKGQRPGSSKAAANL